VSEQHALILSIPKDVLFTGFNPKGTTYRAHDRYVIARGSWQDMSTRWQVADKRLRAALIKDHEEYTGWHFMVRSCDDPAAIKHVVEDRTRTRELTIKSEPVPTHPRFDPVRARWCVLPDDSVTVRIYGNTYWAKVIDISKRGWSATCRFRTLTDPQDYHRTNLFDLLAEGYAGRSVTAVRRLKETI